MYLDFSGYVEKQAHNSVQWIATMCILRKCE